MSNANAIRAGGAFVELFADNSKLVRGLRKAEKHLKDFGGKVKAIGAGTFAAGSAAATALAGSGKVFSEMGDSVAHAAKRTGMTAEAFSGLAYAANLADIETETMEKGVRKMQRTLVAAAGGSKSAEEALAAVGLSATDLLKLTPEQQFSAIADGLNRIKNPAQRASAAMDIFGRGGAAMLPLLQEGSGGIKALTDEAARLGLVISSKDANAGELLDEMFTRMWKTIKQVSFNLGAAMAPTLMDVAKWVIRTAVATSQWIKENKDLVVAAFKVAVAVAAVGAVLIGVGYAISFVGGVLGALATVCTVVSAIWSGLVSVFGLLANPITWIVIGIAAAAAAMLYFSGVGGVIVDWLGECFATLKADAQSTFGGIADALAAGDIALAAKILWLALKMEWVRGKSFLLGIWAALQAELATALANAWYGALAVGRIVWNAIATGWDETIKLIADLWDLFILGVVKGWESVKAAAAKAWNYVKGIWSKGFNVEAANKAVDDAKTQAVADAEANFMVNRSRRDYESEQRAAARDEDLAGIGQESLDVNDAIDAELQRKIAEGDDELAKARAEWQAAIDEAKKKRAAVRDDFAPEPERRGLGDLGDIGGMIRQKLDVRGTFGSFAMFGFGYADSAQERTAKASEKTAKNTDDMKRLIEDMDGATFE